jgi:hypothetical protein
MCRDTLLHGRGIGSPKLLSGKSKLIVSGALIGPETQEGPGQRRDPIREFVGSGDQISRSRPCPGPSGVLGPIEDPEETNLALRFGGSRPRRLIGPEDLRNGSMPCSTSCARRLCVAVYCTQSRADLTTFSVKSGPPHPLSGGDGRGSGVRLVISE